MFTLGATGFVTLFLVLFELVYLPVLSADVPTAQVAGFLLVPVVAAAASWGASLVFEWDITLDEETSEQLSAARKDARKALEQFDDQVDAAASESTLSSLRSFAPAAVESFETEMAAFREECQSVVDRADDLTEGPESSRERNDAAAQVRTDAEGLNPEERANRLQRELERAVVDRIRDEFGDLHYVSRYDQAYEVRNLRSYNEISLPTLDGPPVQIGGDQHELDDRLVNAIDTQGLGPVANAIERVETHLSDLETALDEHETRVATGLDAADESLVLAEDHLDNLDGVAQERLREYLLEGRTPDETLSVPNRLSVSDAKTDAQVALHEGRFDAAERYAKEAREEAAAVQAIAEFFGESVVATIDYGSGSIPVPGVVGKDLTAQLRVPFEQSYGVEYAVKGTTLEIAGDGEATADDHDTARGRTETTTNGADPDDVLYVLRELQSTATASASDDTVELQTEQLPEKFVSDEVLREAQSFAERQGDVVGMEVPEDPPPGFVSIKVADGVSPQRVMDDLQNQYSKNR
ncbi:hypothetical protein EGH21_19630 [Halomicroarcula sp. F13]|uniref:Coiled-coil protein n=1 Tax=Haloarcula rubra TaxID=2487747 RepID=A0AAW4PV97_9EURY|nr:hypothetical protein [Halomicroarcula rubra]MBX0325241.1 hypothetical protein [Halomicroarcula rubra]